MADTCEMISCVFGHDEMCTCCLIRRVDELPEPNDEVTLESIKSHAKICSKLILDNYAELSEAVKRLEPLINKRWKKKGMSKRKELLLRAWPQINECHRPDFAVMRNIKKKPPKAHRLEAYLWPYLNTEDLVQDGPLAVLINSRGRNFPSAFIDQDHRAAHVGKYWPEEVLYEETEMVLGDGQSPETYAKFVTATEESRKSNLTKKCFPPIVGLLVLEIQVRITLFVKDVVMAILSDHSQQQILAAPYANMPTQATIDQPHERLLTLSALALEAPYRVPQDADLSRIQALVSARFAEEADHVWALREDPTYFVATLQDWLAHSADHDQPRSKIAKAAAWKRVAGRVFTEALCSAMVWDVIKTSFQNMLPIQEQIRQASSQTGRLRAAQEEQWVCIEVCLDYLETTYVGLLANRLGYAPRLRSTFVNPQTWEPAKKLSDAATRIHTIFRALVIKKDRKLHGLHPLVQEIQYMLDTDKEVDGYLDSWILDQFSALALVSEIRNCIFRFQPWRRGWENAGVPTNKPVISLKTTVTSYRNTLYAIFVDEAQLSFPSLEIPTDGRFAHPSGKKRTEETTNQLRTSESQLDSVWAHLGGRYREHFKGTHDLFRQMEQRLSGTERRELLRTPKWVADAAVIPKEDNSTLSTFSLLSFEPPAWQQAAPPPKENLKSEIELANSKIKVKPKIRPDPVNAAPGVAAADEGAEAAAEIEEQRPAPRFEVVRRVHEVMTTMLPSGNGEYVQPQEIAWNDLLFAWNAVGLVPEHTYGSVWKFSPNEDLHELGVSQSIQIHMPKAVRRGHKIDAFKVAHFGSRLHRIYGWTGEMFVCN